MPEPQLKGSAYLSTLAFLDTQLGAGARTRVLGRLSDEDRALVSGLILPIQWYPLAPFPRLLRALEDEFGRGDLALVTERGRWAAVHDMRTVHKLLLKVLSTQWVIEKSMRLWTNFHTTGRWEATREGDRGAHAVLHELGVVDGALCASIQGWILGLLTLSGVRQPSVQHVECRAHGHPRCLYRATWK